jgi:tRNA uracil 4-sulfurtransferase
MPNTVIVRYGELGLKGANRGSFEQRLISNIRDCLQKNSIAFDKIRRVHGRIYVDTHDPCMSLSRVFGITTFSPALRGDFDLGKLKQAISELVGKHSFKTFRVSSQRIGKLGCLGSQELNIELGSHVVDAHGKKVSLKGFDLEIGVEYDESEYAIFTARHKSPGGLPLGSNGKAIAILEDDASVLAAWLMMKRGLRIYCLGDYGIPILERYHYGAPLTKISGELEEFAIKHSIEALVTGETLGRIVDRQTELLMLRPLVGMADDEIAARLKNL